jgi:hypothetical protein
MVTLSHAAGASGYVLFHEVAGAELAALLKQKDGGGGELLGDGAETELCFGRVGYLPFEIGVAVAFVEQDLVALSDKDCSHEALAGDIRLDDLVHTGKVWAGGVLRIKQAGGEERNGRDDATQQSRAHHWVISDAGGDGMGRIPHRSHAISWSMRACDADSQQQSDGEALGLRALPYAL